MSIDLSKFQAASEAAEGWLSTVALVAHLGQSGQVGPAFELLMPAPSTKDGRPHNLQDSYRKHAEVLDQARDALAALSDSPVMWEHGRGLSGVARVPAAVYPHVWSSAHEAAAGIARLALEMPAWPLEEISDPREQWTLAQQLLAKCWKALTIPLDERAALCERIRRERAKLLAQKSPPPPPSLPPPRLNVDLARMTITLDGRTYEVGCRNALRWVQVLADHDGAWISGPQLKEYEPEFKELESTRTDRWTRALPVRVRCLIDSVKGKGSRIRLGVGKP